MIISTFKLTVLTIIASSITTSGFVSKSPFAARHKLDNLTPASMSSTSEVPALALDPKDTAVVFIEYQNEFTTEGGALYEAVKDCMQATKTLENSKALLDAARGAGCTVIHVPIAFEEGHDEINKKPYGILAGIKEGGIFKAGSWGTEICYSMRPVKGDIIASGKRGLCGFATTNLDFILRQNECKNVILAGFLTNCCVESTMRTGYELGYRVYTVTDCCAATSVEAQEAAFKHTFGMFSVPSTSTEIMKALKA